MKVKIIKTESVLESLFKGNEVLEISFSPKGNPCVGKLSHASLEEIRNEIEIEKEKPSSIFIEMYEEVTEEPEQPTEPGTPDEPPKQPEVNPETPENKED